MTLNSLARLTGTLLLAAGLVAGSLELGAGGPAQAVAAAPLAPYYQDDELPAYPNALEYPLGEALAVNGLPVRISHFSTPDSAERVRDFYLQAFAEQSAPHQLRRTQDGGFAVSATVAGGAAHAVVVIAPRRDITEVFPSIFPMAVEAAPEGVADEAEVPFSETAVGVMRVADKAAADGDALTWQEPLMSASQTAAFLRSELPKRGWTLTVSDARFGRGGARLEAMKAGRTATFHITPYRSQAQGATVLARYDAAEVLP